MYYLLLGSVLPEVDQNILSVNETLVIQPIASHFTD
jgi:hypothetical protein